MSFGRTPAVKRNHTGTKRSRTLGTRLTEDEYQRAIIAAQGVPASEWVRALILEHLDKREPIDRALMAEFWALRYILVNGIPEPANIATFIQEADQKKANKARAILEGAR